MAITITGNVISADQIPTDPNSQVEVQQALTIDIAGTTISVMANASDIAALTIPSTCTLTLSQP